MEKPPPEVVWDKLEYVHCTESKVAPTIDAIIGGWEIGASLAGLAVTGSSFFIFDLILGMVLVSSYATGWEDAENCKRAKAEIRNRSSMENGFTKKNDEVPDKIIFERAKKCQTKGGVWINNTCQINID
tara:strand:- start:154 stop:540 length:387 start_codon:yes stop_codon:yes gene_type:complete